MTKYCAVWHDQSLFVSMDITHHCYACYKLAIANMLNSVENSSLFVSVHYGILAYIILVWLYDKEITKVFKQFHLEMFWFPISCSRWNIVACRVWRWPWPCTTARTTPANQTTAWVTSWASLSASSSAATSTSGTGSRSSSATGRRWVLAETYKWSHCE